MFVDNTVTRLPNGITNVPVDSIFNSLKMPDLTQYSSFFEDFQYFTAANWTVTETQAGATQALANGDGGILALVNSAANNDVNQVQKVGESFSVTVGKKMFGRFRFSLDDATLAAAAIGLQVTNADGTVLANALDGIFFLKAAAATSVSIYVRQDNATGSVNAVVGNLANATYATLDFFYDGVDRVYYGLNGSVLGYVTAGATILPNTTMAPIAVVKNGSAVARTMNVDYFFVAKER